VRYRAHIVCLETCHAVYFERLTKCLLLPALHHDCFLSYKDHAPSQTGSTLLFRFAKTWPLITAHRFLLLTGLPLQNTCHKKTVLFVSFP